MATIPAVFRRLSFHSDGLRPILLAIVLPILAGCSLQPLPPMALDNGAQPLPDDVRTFATETRPAPGRSRLLDRVAQEAIRQMQALGYRQADKAPDLRIGIRIDRTDAIIPVMDTVESGRLTLVLYHGDDVLRTGRSPNLNSIDLDFMTRDEIAERVRLFLDGIQFVAPAPAKSN
ncbi:hypothetical protein EZI54_14405 [Marinobacter halodurans]|uniref:DUF3016 domain-containing protein n=1 Tax=Marinobacter halodurans TaxID=2528979 RepID=A0ABY1ZK81_9GAMM|nr:hypothetical protein [Marinobacter halodurans]TBW54302.1 hypothetical protein EZI54_14405 [Marinobacter halodurans]